MATAQEVITAGYRRGRIIGRDQTLTAEESADGLAELNRLLDELWIDRLAVFRILSEQFNLVQGQQSYTMGTGGNFNTTRPVKVVPGTRFTIATGIERQLTVLMDRKSWDEIPAKSVQGPPQVIFPDMAYPLANMLFYPTPDQAYVVNIDSWSRLQNVASLVTTISLPPGYESLLINGLAIRLCPENGLEAPASVVRAYGQTKRSLALVNYQLPILDVPSALGNRSMVRPNIVSGDTV